MRDGNVRTRRIRIILLAAIPPLLVAIVAVWAFWLRGGDEPVDVSVYEGDVLVARATRSAALDMAEERIGFHPTIPDELPLDGLSLVTVITVVPPQAEIPRSLLHFVPPGTVGQPESLVILGQSTAYWGMPLDSARMLPLGVDRAEAWALSAPETPGGEYWLHAGDMYVYMQIIATEPVSDAAAISSLRSLAHKLQ